MNPDDILRMNDHRPFSLPEGKWMMRQSWHDLLFAHWPVQRELIDPHIPEQLQLDLWEGTPWITLSPFHVGRLQIRGLPPLPFARSFLELNMRTYVTFRGKQGVYFFSLDASNRLAVEMARLMGLPYMKADINLRGTHRNIHFRLQRTDSRGQGEAFAAVYFPEREDIFHAAPNTLLHWLTERYRMYNSKGKKGLMAVDLHHLPWPLQPANIVVQKNTMAQPLGVQLPADVPLVTYTRQLDALIWPGRNALR